MEKKIRYMCMVANNSRGLTNLLNARQVDPSHIISINYADTGIYCYYYECYR